MLCPVRFHKVYACILAACTQLVVHLFQRRHVCKLHRVYVVFYVIVYIIVHVSEEVFQKRVIEPYNIVSCKRTHLAWVLVFGKPFLACTVYLFQRYRILFLDFFCYTVYCRCFLRISCKSFLVVIREYHFHTVYYFQLFHVYTRHCHFDQRNVQKSLFFLTWQSPSFKVIDNYEITTCFHVTKFYFKLPHCSAIASAIPGNVLLLIF